MHVLSYNKRERTLLSQYSSGEDVILLDINLNKLTQLAQQSVKMIGASAGKGKAAEAKASKGHKGTIKGALGNAKKSANTVKGTAGQIKQLRSGVKKLKGALGGRATRSMLRKAAHDGKLAQMRGAGGDIPQYKGRVDHGGINDVSQLRGMRGDYAKQLSDLGQKANQNATKRAKQTKANKANALGKALSLKKAVGHAIKKALHAGLEKMHKGLSQNFKCMAKSFSAMAKAHDAVSKAEKAIANALRSNPFTAALAPPHDAKSAANAAKAKQCQAKAKQCQAKSKQHKAKAKKEKVQKTKEKKLEKLSKKQAKKFGKLLKEGKKNLKDLLKQKKAIDKGINDTKANDKDALKRLKELNAKPRKQSADVKLNKKAGKGDQKKADKANKNKLRRALQEKPQAGLQKPKEAETPKAETPQPANTGGSCGGCGGGKSPADAGSGAPSVPKAQGAVPNTPTPKVSATPKAEAPKETPNVAKVASGATNKPKQTEGVPNNTQQALGKQTEGVKDGKKVNKTGQTLLDKLLKGDKAKKGKKSKKAKKRRALAKKKAKKKAKARNRLRQVPNLANMQGARMGDTSSSANNSLEEKLKQLSSRILQNNQQIQNAGGEELVRKVSDKGAEALKKGLTATKSKAGSKEGLKSISDENRNLYRTLRLVHATATAKHLHVAKNTKSQVQRAFSSTNLKPSSELKVADGRGGGGAEGMRGIDGRSQKKNQMQGKNPFQNRLNNRGFGNKLGLGGLGLGNLDTDTGSGIDDVEHGGVGDNLMAEALEGMEDNLE